MGEEIEVTVEIPEGEEVAPAPVVIVNTPPTDSGLSDADAIELADLRRERDERLARETQEALLAAEAAANTASVALEVALESAEEVEEVPAPVEEEVVEEPKEDTPPKRAHPFFKKFGE